jgi:hypothetical protein
MKLDAEMTLAVKFVLAAMNPWSFVKALKDVGRFVNDEYDPVMATGAKAEVWAYMLRFGLFTM